jgi:hypothetical protein
VNWAFPWQALIALSSPILLLVGMMTADRALRFRLLYPMVISGVGVLLPVYVITKNERMSADLIGLLYDQPRKQWNNALKRLATFRKTAVAPLVPNV